MIRCRVMAHIHPGDRLLLLPLLALFSAGCQSLPLSLTQPAYDATLDLTVNSKSQQGLYQLSGETNLPTKTRLTVAAVRYLYSADASSPTYSILDYQETEIRQGRWTANLNLWKIAPDGRFQEAWQLDQGDLQLEVTPAPDVVFLAMLAPIDFPSLETKLVQQQIRFASNDLRTTPDGDRYMQTVATLPIALPSGKTAPPPLRPEEINGGWGNRYLILPEPPNTIQLRQPTQRQTNAPLSPDEFLR